MDGEVPGFTVETWWRRPPGKPAEAIRLVKAGQRWEVHRSGCDPTVHPNRSAALLAIADLVGDAWVHEPRPKRAGVR
jgi:hypothetical protein